MKGRKVGTARENTGKTYKEATKEIAFVAYEMKRHALSLLFYLSVFAKRRAKEFPPFRVNVRGLSVEITRKDDDDEGW